MQRSVIKATFLTAAIIFDEWLALAIGCWDKVVDRQTLNWRWPLEHQTLLAK
jgi:hypothetical protein